MYTYDVLVMSMKVELKTRVKMIIRTTSLSSLISDVLTLIARADPIFIHINLDMICL